MPDTTLTNANHNALATRSSIHEHSVIPSGTASWATGTAYEVGDVVVPLTPSGGTGFVYRCTSLNAGSGAAATVNVTTHVATGSISNGSTSLTLTTSPVSPLAPLDRLDVLGAGSGGGH